MVATIIICLILAGIVGSIIYKMIRNARSGLGGCAGCSYAETCAAAKILPRKADCACEKQQRGCCS